MDGDRGNRGASNSRSGQNSSASASGSPELNPRPPHVGSLLRSLCFRELGLFNDANQITAKRIIGQGDFSTVTNRQLMKSRANATPLKEPDDAIQSKKRSRAKAFGLSESDITWKLDTNLDLEYHKQKHSGIVTYRYQPNIPMASPIAVDSYLYIFEMKENVTGEYVYGYTCYEYNYQSGLLKKRYAIQDVPDLHQWRDSSTWYPTLEMIPNKVVAAKPILVTLSYNEKELTTWDLDSGKQLQRITLDKEISFKGLHMLTGEKDIVLKGKRNHSLTPIDLNVYDGILANVQDLTKTTRFRVPQSSYPFGLPMSVKAEMYEFDGALVFGLANTVKIADLFSNLEQAKLSVSNRSALSYSYSNNSVPISHLISDVPKVLYEVKSKGRYLEISDAGYPPHMITVNVNNGEKFITDILTGKKVLNHDILTVESRIDEYESSLRFHPDGSSRVIYTRANLIRIFRLVRTTTESGTVGPSKLEEEFSCEFKGLGHLELTVNSVRRMTITNPDIEEEKDREADRRPSKSQRPRRANTNYDKKLIEYQPSIKYEYAPHVKSLVLMEINPGHDCLFFHYFDNNTWDLLHTLYRENLQMRHIEQMDISEFKFEILEEVIIVWKYQMTKSRYVYDQTNGEVILLPVL